MCFKKIKIPNILVYTIPVFCIFTIILLAYWPGILVSDTMVQWDQIQKWSFDDWHPAYNTIYMALLTKIWNNPGFVLWVQCLIISLAIGYFFDIINKYYNVNKYFIFIMSILFAIIPLNYNFAVTLLKDTLYSTFIIFLTAIVIDIINDKEFFKKKMKCFFLLVVCLVISLFRHNGIIVVAFIGIVLIIAYRKRKLSYIVFGSWLIIHLLMTTVGYKVFNISKNNYANKYGPVSHVMARMLNTPGVTFSAEEMKTLSKYTDVYKLKTTFDKYNMDYSINSQHIDQIKESGSDYAKFGLKKALQYPNVAIKHYIELTSYLYSPKPFKDSRVWGMCIQTDLWVYKEIYPNLNENSKIPQILPYLKKATEKYQSEKLEKITIRPALYMYLSIIMIGIISKIRKNKRIWFIILPTLFNTISLIPAIPVAMVRYVYATMFGFFCIGTWFIYEIFKFILNSKKMGNKLNKINLLLKKDGLKVTLQKVYRYIKAEYISKINVFSFIYVKLNNKKIRKDINEILAGDYERIIIWRSSFGWSVPLFQRPQHIETQLSNKKCLILYEITTVTDKVRTYKKVKDNLYLVNFNNRAIKKLIEEEINNINKPKYIQFYSTDATISVNELKQYINLGYKAIYEYIDDISPLLVGAKELPINLREKYEYMLQNTEDVFVVVTADEILKDVLAKRKNEKIVFSCNGVDYNHFTKLEEDYNFEDGYINILNQKKPIIGYYGALATWFDYSLLKKLAKERPDYNIVLFGIKYDGSFDEAHLEDCKNIYFLGAREYKVLPYYAKEFTICTIPFVINSITNATSPVKLFEYMALDKPIVTTAMSECKKYKSVMIANNHEEFICLVDKAVKMNKQDNKEYFEILKREALENTWDEKANLIVDLLKKYE